MIYGVFTDGQEQTLRGEAKGATPFTVVKVQAERGGLEHGVSHFKA